MEQNNVTIHISRYAELVKAEVQRDALLRLLRKHYNTFCGIDRTTLEAMFDMFGADEE